MTTENFKVISNEDVHEYTITVEKENDVTRYLLFASQATLWTQHIRGVLLTVLVDTGNGFNIADNKNLDYAEAQQLRMLLNFSTHYDKTAGPTYTAVQETIIGEI